MSVQFFGIVYFFFFTQWQLGHLFPAQTQFPIVRFSFLISRDSSEEFALDLVRMKSQQGYGFISALEVNKNLHNTTSTAKKNKQNEKRIFASR